MKKMNCDVLIVGSGVAGLIAALELSNDLDVVLITKKELKDSNSYLAQGGISRRMGIEDREAFIKDTLAAGHYKNNLEAVEILVDESESAIETLINYGVDFTKFDEKLAYTKEGGHSKSRIVYHEDVTGQAVMEALIKIISQRSNIRVIEYCEMEDIIEVNQSCVGVLANKENEPFFLSSKLTILATGGLEGMYKNTTGFSHIKGDGVAAAIRHNVKLKDISCIQIHPTSLYENKSGRRFLISESVRGEGAKLLNHKNERFVDELRPRDYVAQAIFSEMEKDESEFEWLSLKEMNGNIHERFPNICNYLKEIGIDPKEDYVPVTPAYHYTMGGIAVDMDAKTGMDRLYAVGETACTGVHGENRLASNSLLECVVFGKRAAKSVMKEIKHISSLRENAPEFSNYTRLNEEEQSLLIKERIKEDERIKLG